MGRRWLILGAAVTIVAAVAGVAFLFGTPQAPHSPAAVATSPAASGGVPVAGGGTGPAAETGGPGGAPFGGGEVVAGEVPEPDPGSPFAFEIPGCRCHSDDPAIVEEHAQYRLNQCSGCHAGSP